MKRNKWIFLLTVMLAVSFLLPGCSDTKERRKPVINMADLEASGVTIGIVEGSASANAVKAHFAGAELQYFPSLSDGYMALEYGKIDAFSFDQSTLDYVAASNPALAVLPDSSIGTDKICVGTMYGNEALIAKVNEFIASYIADGTAEEMYDRWMRGNSEEMPDIPEPAQPTQTLVIGTDGLNKPSSYLGKDGVLMGYDIEFAKRLAYDLNVKIELQSMPFPSLLASTASGKIDLLIANLNKTDEREETILFSDCYLETDMCLLVRREQVGDTPKTADDFDNAVVGVLSGSISGDNAKERMRNPQIAYYNNVSDLVMAVQNQRCDCFLVDEPVARCLVSEQTNLSYSTDGFAQEFYGFGFPKDAHGEKLCNEMNQFLASLASDGTRKQLIDGWLEHSAEQVMTELPRDGGKEKLRVCTSSCSKPFAYVRNGTLVGYEMELLARFCKEYGYSVEIEDSDFSGLVAGTASHKYDMVFGFLSITDERKENMLFSDPDYESSSALVYPSGGEQSEVGFLVQIKESFEKNFLRENRWKLVLDGIYVTLIISTLSILFGTLFGFFVCLLRMSGSRLLRGIAKTFVAILQGTPMVVLLMIFYYVIFAKIFIDSIIVAAICFGLNFAAYVSEMMRTGVEAVDKGQIEAAYAIGFGKLQTFRLIVFPQAARRILPVYRGEFISLVKMTSVVGYIAIQDLTKVSDIIRSCTYEAFFPLISTALIYFVLTYLLAFALTALQKKLEPDKTVRRIKGVMLK